MVQEILYTSAPRGLKPGSHLKWEATVRPWRADPIPHDPTVAETRIKTCQQYLLVNSATPDAGMIRRYVVSVEPIAKRAGDDGAVASLNKLFKGPLMQGLWVIRLTSGDKLGSYYFKSDPTKNTSDMPTLGFIVNFSLAEQRRLFKRSELN